MAAAQAKEHEGEKHTGIRKKARDVGSKAKMQENRTQGVYSNKVPVSATKPSRGPCHIFCHIFPALVDSGIKCHYCRCQAPLFEQINEHQTKLIGLGGCSDSGSTF